MKYQRWEIQFLIKMQITPHQKIQFGSMNWALTKRTIYLAPKSCLYKMEKSLSNYHFVLYNSHA